MKKLFITAAIATMFSVTAFAKGGNKTTTVKTGEDKISYTVLNEFNAEFKDAKNAAWTVTPNCEKVTFTLEGKKLTAFYDGAGTYLGLTQAIEYKDIPYSAQEEINAKYAGYAVKEVIKYVGEDTGLEVSPVAYFVDLKNEKKEFLVKAVDGENVEFFKTIK